ncbi:MAG: phosphopentomutase [Eubacteriales bacterium]
MAERTRRVFLIVLDSVGIGAEPDAADFGDSAENNTLRRIAGDKAFCCDTVRRLGMGYMDGVSWMGTEGAPRAAVARMRERSRGKDTTIGHWEIAGIVSDTPLPTYSDGFPDDVLNAFRAATGRGVLCNQPYSGTEVIRDYGREHLATGDLIVYTSADSVFQIAAHESVVPPEQLYAYCRAARNILTGKNAVGRVIARPFTGEYPDFTRTANRRDFSLEPPAPTMLDAVAGAGMDVISVGKIRDIFAGRGVTEAILTHGNDEGMRVTAELAARDFTGLCFVNLVDFDSAYGHRNDVPGYAAAFAQFDRWLSEFLLLMREDDVLMICADHGCDPGDVSTDHTREYTPLLITGAGIRPVNLGTRPSFSDIAATVCELLGVDFLGEGVSFAQEIARRSVTDAELLEEAKNAMTRAYAPYSGYRVGAALLTEQGSIYCGCNIENASYGATVCAERTAFQRAVWAGERSFAAIAVVGGKDGVIADFAPPCGICRQVMTEFCDPETFRVILSDGVQTRTYSLAELLPLSFGPGKLHGGDGHAHV